MSDSSSVSLSIPVGNDHRKSVQVPSQITRPSSPYVFTVERHINGNWRLVRQTHEDTAAASVAEALVRQSPNEGVRILMSRQGEAEGPAAGAMVIWEYEGRLFLPRRDAATAATGGASPASAGPEPTRLIAFNLLGQAGHAPRVPDPRRNRSNVSRMLVLATAIVAIFLTATSFLRQGTETPLPRPSPTSPRHLPSSAASPQSSTPREVSYSDINYKQLAVARYYAYQTCIADALAAGIRIIRHSFESGRISATLTNLYETQFRDVLKTREIARNEIVRHGNHDGGLTRSRLDFIDEWFRLNRDVLIRSGRYVRNDN